MYTKILLYVSLLLSQYKLYKHPKVNNINVNNVNKINKININKDKKYKKIWEDYSTLYLPLPFSFNKKK